MSQTESERLYAQIADDFAALVAIIDRAIASLEADGGGGEDVERLRRARDAAESGIAMIRDRSAD